MSGFCPHPFNRVHLATNGDVYICCRAWCNVSLGNIFNSDFEAIWNSDNAKLIRESIFDGSFRFCNKKMCPLIVSGRHETSGAPIRFKEIYEKKQWKLDFGPEHISVNYDNSCNIQCKACRNHLIMIDKENAQKLIEFNNSLINSDLFKNAKRVLVGGNGEVFASPVYLDFLSRMDEKKYPNLKITIRTNGQLLNPANWEKINNAHYAIDEVNISIDAATKNTYEEIRYGGKFDKLLGNLEFIKKLKRNNQFLLIVNFLVQQRNFTEMIPFVKLAKKYDVDTINFSQLDNRGTYSHEEYSCLAVQKKEHSQFKELENIVNDPIFDDPKIFLSNLSFLRKTQKI